MTGARQFAMPGDPDLDLNLTDVAVAAVSRAGHSFVVTFRGGHGDWVGTDGHRARGVRDCTGDMVFGWPSAHVGLLDQVEALLTRWAGAGTPLRMTMAPGRTGLLWEPYGEVLPLARRSREVLDVARPF